MTPRSRAGWPRGWRRAWSPTSTATAGRSARRLPRADRRALRAFVLLGAVTSCAYLNTFYNAEKAYDEGVRLRVASGDTLTASAQSAFERAIEKSAVVLDRHPDSAYADDALLLMGRGLLQLERYVDASAALRRLLDRFPDGDLAASARLELARSQRLLGDYDAARATLGILTETEHHGVDPAELLYEKGLIDLATGDHEAAIAALGRLLSEYPEFARDREVALRFADVELASGRPEAAIEAYSAHGDEVTDPNERRSVTLKIARAMALAGRRDEAIETYGDLLGQGIADSLAAEVFAARGELHAAASRWDAADEEFRQAAELAPGSAAAARATLGRARIEWRVRGLRDQALEILLDAFLHAPASSWGDSARTAARGLERILHYARIAEGEAVVAGLDDPDLVRSTALYRLAEEILEVEEDPVEAASVFERIAREHPDSPWAPSALLASGLLAREAGALAEGETALRRLVERYPDHPAADSARRALGVAIPDRPAAFYADRETLIALARALPRAEDPMIRIVDQLGRYARTTSDGRGATGTAPAASGQPATTDPNQPPPETPEVPPDPDRPRGVVP